MSKNKKIVMLGTRTDACGGIASVIQMYAADGLFERKPILYLPTHCSGASAEKIRLFLGAMSRLIWMILARELALVHVHVAINASFWRKYSFLLVLFVCAVPTVLHVHAGRFPEYYEKQSGRLARALIRFALGRVHHVIVVSEELNRWISPFRRGRKVTTIGNPATACAVADMDTGAEPTLLFLGHIEHCKGAFDLIRAMPGILAVHPDATLRLCGDGQLAQARSLIDSLALNDSVELMGWVDQRHRDQLLRQASVFVLPSYFEGLPMSLLEAMASGLPVVATAVGGIPEAVSNGVEGVLVDPGDVEAISAAVCRLLGDSSERLRMGSAGKSRVAHQFSRSTMVAAIETLYDQLILECERDKPSVWWPAAKRGALTGKKSNIVTEARNEDLV